MAPPINLSRQRMQAAAPLANIFIANRPELPPDVVKRFPSLHEFQKRDKEWIRKLTFQLQGGGR